MRKEKLEFLFKFMVAHRYNRVDVIWIALAAVCLAGARFADAFIVIAVGLVVSAVLEVLCEELYD